MEKAFCIVLYTLLVISCLQLFVITCAKPIPATEEAAVNKTECNCNGTNLTMMVDGHFLHNWLKFNSHHSIRHLSEEAGKLLVNYEQVRIVLIFHLWSQSVANYLAIGINFYILIYCFAIIYLQLEPCYYEYNKSFNWTYHRSQPVTHVLLKQLYNVFILHRRFIQEKLLVSGIDIYTNKSLNVINRELNQNIAQLYYVVSKSLHVAIASMHAKLFSYNNLLNVHVNYIIK